MRVNFYGDIGTHNGTYTATDTAGGIMHLGIKITSHGYILGHRENLLRADLNTQLAPFAVVLVNDNSRHLLLSRFGR